MRNLILITLAFMAGSLYGAAPVITPSVPTVYVGSGTVFHADQSVTWVVIGTGTIDSVTGVYTAPGPIPPKGVVLGCPMGPNDDIFHANVSSLPILTSSDTYFHVQLDSTGVSIEPDIPENVYNNATSSTNLVFAYTPTNNGYFKLGSFPNLRIENGFFSDWTRVDQHLLSVNTDSCEMSEVYKLYPVGVNTFNPCPTCNSQSGFTSHNDYTLHSPTVDAAGLPITHLLITGAELRQCVDRGIPIQHASRITLSSGRLAQSFIWPATTWASASGQLPYGTKIRLKASYPVGSFSPAAQCILNSWKVNGLQVADIGLNMHVQMSQDSGADFDLFKAVAGEFQSTTTLNAWQFNVVDQSSLEDLDPNSPTYRSSRVVHTSTSATPSNYSIVVASNTSTHLVSYMPVIVQPVTIGVDKPFGYSFLANTPATQLNVWVHGSTDTTFTCGLSPSLGSITTGGLYTAPVSAAVRSTTTVTCTATMDPTARVDFPVIVYSTGGIRQALSESTNSDFSDAQGNRWYADRGTEWRLQGHANCDWSYLPQNPWAVDVSSIYYHCQYVNSGSGDLLYRAYMPNGAYRLTFYLGVGGLGPFSRGVWEEAIDYQGQIYSPNTSVWAGDGPWTQMGITGRALDICDVTQGCQAVTPGQIVINTEVTDNTFYFAIRHLVPAGGNVPSSMLNAFSIEPIVQPPARRVTGNCKITGNPTNIH